MSLTPAQRQTADAYAQVFASTAATQFVLDDLTQMISGMPLDHQAGATRTLLYILLKRSAIRREKTREKANG